MVAIGKKNRVFAMKSTKRKRTVGKQGPYRKTRIGANPFNSGVTAAAIMGFPRMIRTKMCYRAEYLALNPTAGGLAASHVFSASGVYDPDITATGHQPVGFDQYMAMYDHFIVLGAKIVATFTNQDTANRMTAVVYVNDDNAVNVDLRIPIENGTCAFTQLDIASTANAQKTLTLEIDPIKYQGLTNPFANSQLKGDATSNPIEQCFFVVAAAPDIVVDAGNVGVSVTIYYDVAFIERKRTGLS